MTYVKGKKISLQTILVNLQPYSLKMIYNVKKIQNVKRGKIFLFVCFFVFKKDFYRNFLLRGMTLSVHLSTSSETFL